MFVVNNAEQKYFFENIKGLLNWYWWILARVDCKNAQASQCILKSTSANIHKYQFNNSFILWLKHIPVNLHVFSVISHLGQRVQYRQPHYLLPRSICFRLHERFLWKSSYDWFYKSLLIQLIHTCFRFKSLLLSNYDDNIPTFATNFVYNGVLDIAHSVRNVCGVHCFTWCKVSVQ